VSCELKILSCTLHVERPKRPQAVAEFGGMDPCTFVTFDFYEFETEHTAIRYGRFPRYDSVSQYIVDADEVFVEYVQFRFPFHHATQVTPLVHRLSGQPSSCIVCFHSGFCALCQS
jgi:hypothetical protein